MANVVEPLVEPGGYMTYIAFKAFIDGVLYKESAQGRKHGQYQREGDRTQKYTPVRFYETIHPANEGEAKLSILGFVGHGAQK